MQILTQKRQHKDGQKFHLSSCPEIGVHFSIIVEVSKDDNGMLLYQKTMGGIFFQTHGISLCPEQSARTIAKWEAALDDLVASNILKPESSKWAIFRLTALGFQIADKLLGSKQ